MDDDESVYTDEEDEDLGESTWESGNDMNDFPPGTILG